MREPRATIARAMILAAGFGTRLRPLTDHLPKPLVPVLGRPLLARVVDTLRAAGVQRVAVNSHHLPEQIARCVEGLALSDHACEYRLLHEARILGTGGALVNARAFLTQDDAFLLHNGDVLTDLDLTALVAAHRDSGALATLALTDCPEANSVLLGPDAAVLDINGRHAVAPATGRLLTYTGVAVLGRDLFRHLPDSGYATLVEALLSALAERPGAVRGFAPPGLYWNDLGTVARLLAVHDDLLVSGRLTLPGLGTRPRPIHIGEGAVVMPGARLEGFVSLGRGARVAAGARLKDCVILDSVTVPADAAWRRAVLGPGWTVTQEENEISHLALVRAAGFGAEARVERLVEQGSDRAFWRLCAPGPDAPERSAVLLRTGTADPEFGRYVAIARFLDEADLGGPRLLAADPEQGAILMEDLGDATLHRLATTTLEPLRELYRPVLDLLVELQVRGTASLPRCPEAGDRLFDHATLRWETDYFRLRFLVALRGVAPDQASALDGEFERLARATLKQPVVLMHRDFQAQNILFKDDRVRLVDFQGMRRGPLLYDVVSLLRDPYVDLPAAERAALLAYYRQRLATRGGPALSADELQRLAVTAGLQRIMQALGAFAFLSAVKGKAWYAQWLPVGLRQLVDLLDENTACGGEPGPLPCLTALVKGLGP